MTMSVHHAAFGVAISVHALLLLGQGGAIEPDCHRASHGPDTGFENGGVRIGPEATPAAGDQADNGQAIARQSRGEPGPG